MSAIHILGTRIDDVTLDEACARAATLIGAGGTHQFATVNPEFVMTARRNPRFHAALEHSALNVPDGVGIMLAARWLGRPLRERVTGVALMQRLCTLAADRGWGVYLLGAAPGVAERAAAALTRRHPTLRIVGTHAGSPAPADRADIVARIRAAQPQLLFVAYGAPAQDVWLAEVLGVEFRVPSAGFGVPGPESRVPGSAELDPTQRPSVGTQPRAPSTQHPAPRARDPELQTRNSELSTPNSGLGLLGMGVGGTFDYLAGVRKLAPAWVRSMGFEWLYRLLQEPSRWRRQLNLLRFAGAVLASRFKDRR